MQKVNLCDACSKEKGVQDPTGFALADLLLGIGAAEELKRGADPALPGCGFTQGDFKKTGRLGCSTCYATFTEALTALLKAMHKGNSACRQSPPTRASRRRIERQDAKPERKPPKSGGGRELRDGRVVTRPDQNNSKANWRDKA